MKIYDAETFTAINKLHLSIKVDLYDTSQLYHYLNNTLYEHGLGMFLLRELKAILQRLDKKNNSRSKVRSMSFSAFEIQAMYFFDLHASTQLKDSAQFIHARKVIANLVNQIPPNLKK